MTTPPLAVNKRTVLGGQYWTIGAVIALASDSVPLAALLVAVGAYLVLAPRLRREGCGEPSEF